MELLRKLYWFFAAYLFGYVRAKVLFSNHGQGRKIGTPITIRVNRKSYPADKHGARFVRYHVELEPGDYRCMWSNTTELYAVDVYPRIYEPTKGDAALFEFNDTSVAGVVFNGWRWVGITLPGTVRDLWLNKKRGEGCLTMKNGQQVVIPKCLGGLGLSAAVIIDLLVGRIDFTQLLLIYQAGLRQNEMFGRADMIGEAARLIHQLKGAINSRLAPQAAELLEKAELLTRSSIA